MTTGFTIIYRNEKRRGYLLTVTNYHELNIVEMRWSIIDEIYGNPTGVWRVKHTI